MKKLHLAPSVAPLLLALFAAACSSDNNTNGGNGGSANGGAPAADGGSANGGTATTGGASNAGASSGGASNGGSPSAGAGGTDPAGMHWVATWGTSNQVTEPRNLPMAADDKMPYPENPGFAGNTVRQVVHVSIGGSKLRLRLSNLYGTTPVSFDSVHVAKWKGDGKIDTATDKALSFAGMPSATVKNGETVTSDTFDFDVPALSDVAITFKVGTQSKEVTGHPGSRTTSYIQTGDAVTQESFDSPMPIKTPHWYFIEGLDVMAEAKSAAVVALGDSLTDGRGSNTDKNDRWTDALAKRLQDDPSTKHVAVVNAGIGGNQVLTGGLGPTAKVRFDHDVLGIPGVKWVIVWEGVNDIGNSTTDVSADLIAAFQEFVTKAKAKSVKAYGATITGFKTNGYDTGDHLMQRTTVNTWIRMPGSFDGVFDFDKAVADPADPDKLAMMFADPSPAGVDYLHMNPDGYKACAAAVDLSVFK